MISIFIAIGLLAGLALLTIEIPVLTILILVLLGFIVVLISQKTWNSIWKTIVTPPTINISLRPGKYVVYARSGMLLAVIIAFMVIPIDIGPLRWTGIFASIIVLLFPFLPRKDLKW